MSVTVQGEKAWLICAVLLPEGTTADRDEVVKDLVTWVSDLARPLLEVAGMIVGEAMIVMNTIAMVRQAICNDSC